jgi:FdhD protein
MRIKTQNSELTPAESKQIFETTAKDQDGNLRTVLVPVEAPLTIRLNNSNLATLMTIGTHPRELAVGFLRNQMLLNRLEEIDSISLDEESETVSVLTHSNKPVAAEGPAGLGRIVTSGCGQGSLFNCLMDKIYELPLCGGVIHPPTVFDLLKNLQNLNGIYRKAGSVHGCALCRQSDVLIYIEDIGRHNAADVISGKMLIDGTDGNDKIFFTTGRLTSEIIIKAAIMRIPILLSKSGATSMALELAQELGITLVARAKGGRFLIYNEAVPE